MTFTRGATSKDRLRIDWDYPVHVPEQGHTVASGALAAEAAFAEIADGDPRPLLVLRECHACAGTDLALLSADQINDRTLLLTGWFHCVKFPADVLAENSRYRNLFGGGNHPPHLFVCHADGSHATQLDGRQSQNKLWTALTATLRAAYPGNVEGAMKELLALLDQFDRVDAQIEGSTADLDRELARSTAKSPRIAELQKRVKDAMAQRAELLNREKELRDLSSAPASPAPLVRGN